MRFRQFLLKLKVWRRFRGEKKRANRLSRQLDDQKRTFEAKLAEKARFYEKRLAVERIKLESVIFSWADRLLQSQKLLSVSHVTHDLDDKAERQLEPRAPEQIDPEKELTGDELNFYLDTKEGFWEAELEAGRSEAEILTIWNRDFKAQELARAKSALF